MLGSPLSEARASHAWLEPSADKTPGCSNSFRFGVAIPMDWVSAGQGGTRPLQVCYERSRVLIRALLEVAARRLVPGTIHEKQRREEGMDSRHCIVANVDERRPGLSGKSRHGSRVPGLWPMGRCCKVAEQRSRSAAAVAALEPTRTTLMVLFVRMVLQKDDCVLKLGAAATGSRTVGDNDQIQFIPDVVCLPQGPFQLPQGCGSPTWGELGERGGHACFQGTIPNVLGLFGSLRQGELVLEHDTEFLNVGVTNAADITDLKTRRTTMPRPDGPAAWRRVLEHRQVRVPVEGHVTDKNKHESP
mmetsp:Transcript_25577/g.74651  ORF Transcript_25577/g.74651 Transcript_25577/m.74651 type:complete len:303 (+) Transcript_25577:683-1591(+)